jgi:hypothetical protein
MIHEVHHFRAIRTLFLLLLLPEAVHGVIMGVYRPLSKDNVWLLVDAIPQKIVNNTVGTSCLYFHRYNGKERS